MSENWPYGDGSHAEVGDERGDILYTYHREDGGIVREEVTDVPDADPRG